MEKPVPKQLAHPLAHGDAEALRIKVTLVLLKVMIVACVAFIVSYVASGKFALIPWLAIPFLLPSLALHHLLTKQRKYRYILWFLIYLFTALGLMKLTSAPDYLVDLFLIPTYIGACFLVLRHQHAVPMVVYLLAIYAVAAAVVYRFHPFPILYTNDNLSSVVTGFVLSIIGSTVTFYVFSKSYQQNSDRLSDTLYTLGKVNDDNKLLINVVTHDFRNYLTRLVLLIDICKSKSDDGSTLRELDNLEDAIHKLSELIGDVQTVRDLSSDKARQTTKPVAFGEMLKKIDLIFRHQMVVKQLAFDKAGVQPLTLDVNPDIFTHIILSNLIGNAIKF
ncbi:MAG TPA: hypothetical protein VMH83_15615, partial [Candidatus Acidoferrum sp.]|nr:hypothetical protein [Candidatus Acidoferrum sp.]